MKYFIVIFVFLFLVVPVSHSAELVWDESPNAIGYKIYTSDKPELNIVEEVETNYTLWVKLYVADAAPAVLEDNEAVIQDMIFPVPEGQFSGIVYFRATAFNHGGESDFTNFAKGSFGPLEVPKRFHLPLP